jgi:hypothetical protein
MSAFRPAGTERVNVFPIGDNYLFKHYFDRDKAFSLLKDYYNNKEYRFEVPAEEFDPLRDSLLEYGYGLVVVDAIAEFEVVVKRYRSHPDNIFEDSVIMQIVDGYNCFLLTDQEAVDRAVKQGAIRLVESEFTSPF